MVEYAAAGKKLHWLRKDAYKLVKLEQLVNELGKCPAMPLEGRLLHNKQMSQQCSPHIGAQPFVTATAGFSKCMQ